MHGLFATHVRFRLEQMEGGSWGKRWIRSELAETQKHPITLRLAML